jgi:hypothetical protein
LLEAHDVLCDLLIVFHPKSIEFVLSVGFRVEEFEICLELGGEFRVVGGPDGVLVQIHETGFEVVQVPLR